MGIPLEVRSPTSDPLEMALNFRDNVDQVLHAVAQVSWAPEFCDHLSSELHSTLECDARLLAVSVNEYLSDRKNLRLLGKSPSHHETVKSLLNVFDSLLDYHDGHRMSSGENMCCILQGMLRLARKTGQYPDCFTLSGLTEYTEHPVAAGGFGEVHRGILHGQEVCLKVVKVYQRSAVEDILKTYIREATIWRYLNHPNVVPFYGIYYLDHHRSRLCLVSPWFRNGNLVDFLIQNPYANRLVIALDIACGIAYLHKNSIVHCDLKGANILITEHHRACISDFGLSSISESMAIRWTTLSIAGCRGTCRWRAPELFPTDVAHNMINTKESDMYAFAGVLYETFSGNIPFCEVKNDAQVMFMILRGETPPRPPHITNDRIWDLMKLCWQPQPAQRPNAEQAVAMTEDIMMTVPTNPTNWDALSHIQVSLRQPSPFVPLPEDIRIRLQGWTGSFPAVQPEGDEPTLPWIVPPSAVPCLQWAPASCETTPSRSPDPLSTPKPTSVPYYASAYGFGYDQPHTSSWGTEQRRRRHSKAYDTEADRPTIPIPPIPIQTRQPSIAPPLAPILPVMERYTPPLTPWSGYGYAPLPGSTLPGLIPPSFHDSLSPVNGKKRRPTRRTPSVPVGYYPAYPGVPAFCGPYADFGSHQPSSKDVNPEAQGYGYWGADHYPTRNARSRSRSSSRS